MKSKLKAITPKAAKPSKPKILIFGKPGVGKTWTSLDFPSVYYIDTEGGADLGHYTDKLEKAGGVYFGIEQGSLDFNNVLEQVQALATEDHGYKTLVIDSITKIFNLDIVKEGERLEEAKKKNEFGIDRKPALAKMRKLIGWLQRLDMNVILIAHEKPLWGINSNGERVEIGVTFDAWEKLEYELHLCLNIINAGGNRLAKVRKTRLIGFPDATILPWSYKDFAEKHGKDVMEQKSEKLVLATPEQLIEIKHLTETVKLPEGIQDKWLTAANASNFDEMDTDKLQAIIDMIKTKYQKINTGE